MRAAAVGRGVVATLCFLVAGVAIGARARIDAGAQVERAVLWEGTHLAAGERVVDQIAAPGIRLEA